MVDFYSLKATLPKEQTYDFSQLKGKVVLISNTASRCGFTPQLEGLQELHNKYKDQGLVVLGFPSNEFGGQSPEDDEGFGAFCMKNYGVDFTMAAKSKVNGSDANEVFKYLKTAQKGVFGTEGIKWNFTKFLVDKNGKVVERYGSTTKPSAIEDKIKKLLEEPAAAL